MLQFDYPSSDRTLALGNSARSHILHLETCTGIVTEIKERSDTSVYGIGTRELVTVDSVRTIVQELWIKTLSGREECIKVSDWGIEARRDHTVTIVWGRLARQAGKPLFCYNHTTGRFSYSEREVRSYFSPSVSVFKLLRFPGWLVALVLVGWIIGVLFPPLYKLSVIAIGIGLAKYALSLKPSDQETGRAISQIRSALSRMSIPL